MILLLLPQRNDGALAVSVAGDVLTLNADTLDFSQLQNGATLPRTAINNPWIAGDVTRSGGVLYVPLVLPHGPDASQAARFPQPINVLANGPVELPQ